MVDVGGSCTWTGVFVFICADNDSIVVDGNRCSKKTTVIGVGREEKLRFFRPNVDVITSEHVIRISRPRTSHASVAISKCADNDSVALDGNGTS